MIYLDNAATSFPKPLIVNTSIFSYLKLSCANPGRSGHHMSVQCGRKVFEVRQKLADFFNIQNPLNIVFTKNTTEALNFAIKGFLKEGSHVITTCMEHNSVLRPLFTLKKDNFISLSVINADSSGLVDPQDVLDSINSKTSLIVCTISSNVNGIVMPILDIGKIAKEKGIKFLVDGAQGAGILNIDVQKMNIDFLAFTGHKSLLGPQGTGGLYVKDSSLLIPIIQGGTGSHSESLYQPDFLPDSLEAGTLNTPGIIGLSSSIDFINEIKIDNIQKEKGVLIKRLYNGIQEIKNTKIYSPKEIELNSGIVAFNINGKESSYVCERLDSEYDIECRGGIHCAPLAHKHFNTMSQGIVRLSPGYFNNLDEIDYTIKAIKNICYS